MQRKTGVLLGLAVHLVHQIPLEPHQLDGVAHPQGQHLRVEGLFDEIHRPQAQSLHLGLKALVRRQEDDGDLLAGDHLRFQPLHGLKPVHPRHLDIQEDQVRVIVLYIFQQRRAGFQGGDAHILFAQYVAGHFQVRHIIVHDDHPIRHSSKPPSGTIVSKAFSDPELRCRAER